MIAVLLMLLGMVLGAALVAGRDGAVLGATIIVVVLAVWSARWDRPRTSAERAPKPAEALPMADLVTLPDPVPGATLSGGGDVAVPVSAPVARPAARSRALPHVANLRWKVGALASALVLASILLPDLSGNPVGFFCDEAETALATYHFIHDAPLSFPVFYQHFSYAHLGALPLYAAAPFVAVMGLSEESARLASVVWFAAAALVLVALVRRLGWRYGEVGVVAFAATPVFLHYARINFAHAGSLFLVALGLYLYAVAWDRDSGWLAGLAGASIGISIYGNGAYYVAAPIILAGLAIGEVAVNRFAWRRYRRLIALAAGAAFVSTPALDRLVNDPEFSRRFDDKQQSSAPLLSVDRLTQVVDNYPKYFDIDFLFRVGESGLHGSFLSRHSVAGAGTLSWLVLPLLVLGVVGVVRISDPRTRLFGIAGLVILALFPLPDAFVSPRNDPPYTVAVFSTLIFVPLLAGLGVHYLATRSRFVSRRFEWLAPALILTVALIGAVRFNDGPYRDYPLVSADYWGWQYGASEAITAFDERRNEFPAFVMDGDFNEAYVFLDFYLVEDPELRAKARIGYLEEVNSTTRALYAVRIERYNRLVEEGSPLMRITEVTGEVRYPDGSLALVLVEVDIMLDDGSVSLPR